MKTKTTLHSELKGHVGPLYSLSESSLTKHIYSGGSDKTVARWNLETSSLDNFSVKLQHTIYSMLFLKESNHLWIGQSQGGIHVIDLENKKEIKLLQAQKKGIFDLKYHPIEKIISSCSADGSIVFWNASDFTMKSHLMLTAEKVRYCSSNPDNNLIAIARGDGLITILNVNSNSEVKTFHAHNLSSNVVKFHPNLPLLISGGRDAHINIWDINNDFKKIDSIPAHHYAIYDIAFHPNLPMFATASRDKSIKLWNAENGLFLEKFENKTHNAHTHSVNKLLWSNFNNLLISTGDDAKINTWKIEINDEN